MKGQYQTKPVSAVYRREVDCPHGGCHDHTEHQPQQHRDIAQEAAEVFGDHQDEGEYEERHTDELRIAKIRIANPACGPVRADAHQAQAHHQNFCTNHNWRKETQ
ncbi:hypothetical protein D3C85_1424680 [compost metagenome]